LIPTNELADVNFIPRPQADMAELKIMQEKILKNLI
jgi:hypothetical protein